MLARPSESPFAAIASRRERAATALFTLCLTGCLVGGEPSEPTAVDAIVNGSTQAGLTSYWKGMPCLVPYGQGYCSSGPFNFALVADGTLVWSVDGRFGRSTWTRLGPRALVLDRLPFEHMPSMNINSIEGSLTGGVFTATAGSAHNGNARFTVQTGALPGYCGCMGSGAVKNVNEVRCVELPDGQCDYASCASGFGDCDGQRANGCEVSLSAVHVSGAACEGACSPGYLDCDGRRDNGCEREIPGSLHATGVTCANNVLDYGSCAPGYLDCNLSRADGCEATIPSNMNATGIRCATSGFDYQDCNPGHIDCDGNRGNGCEVDVATRCPGTQNVNGRTYACNVASCAYASCVVGYFDCDGDPATGCEATSAAGCPVKLATGAGVGIAVDSTDVYWVGDGKVQRVPIDGGSTTLLELDQTPVAVAVDSTHVYWGCNSTDGVGRMAKSGGPVSRLYAGNVAYAIAIDSTRLYWTDYVNLNRMPLAGGTLTTVGQFGTGGVTVDSSHLYSTTNSGQVWRVPLDGGVAARLDNSVGTSPAFGIATDSTHVYWSSGDGIFKVAIGGGAPVRLAQGGVREALAVDERYIYWSSSQGTFATPLGGLADGGSHLPVAGQSARAIAVDGVNVYFVTGAGVFRTPRP